MSISPEDVRYIARLARLRLSEEDVQHLAAEMRILLDYIDKLKELDTADVPAMAHVLDLYNVYRSQEAQQRISSEDALAQAPDADGTYFRVPKVIP